MHICIDRCRYRCKSRHVDIDMDDADVGFEYLVRCWELGSRMALELDPLGLPLQTPPGFNDVHLTQFSFV